MKQKNLCFFLLLSMIAFFACTEEGSHQEMEQIQEDALALRKNPQNERVVVANRASSNITVLDAATNAVLNTYDMPDDGMPMYAVHIPQAKAVFVGDRANDRVVAFDEDDFSVVGTVPAGDGVFHMWAAPNGSQLWVNNDIDNTTTVINPASMKVKGTAETPADLVALGGKPHDVFFDPEKKFAYVSVLGVAGPNDYVVKYNTNKYEEVDRVAVGKDPHLFADDVNNMLYVACQGTSDIHVVNRTTMEVAMILPFDNAHGIFMPGSGDYVYVANISSAELGVFETSNHTQVGVNVSTPHPTPHNLTINAAEDKLFITHSGASADQLSIYSLDPVPVHEISVTVGTNPFGLVYYAY